MMGIQLTASLAVADLSLMLREENLPAEPTHDAEAGYLAFFPMVHKTRDKGDHTDHHQAPHYKAHYQLI